MEIMEAIKTRRSIRDYKTTGVEDKDIELVLDAARWAPSWINFQVWRFIIVRDGETKAKLSELTHSNPAAGAVKNAPVVIALCAELGKSGCYLGQPTTDRGEIWYMFDVALAAQNLMLAARSLGLGTVAVCSRINSEEIASVLNIPEGFIFVALIPLGYPNEEPEIPERKELSELVFYEKFGRTK